MEKPRENIKTHAQAIKDMNTGDMAQFIGELIEDISGVKINYETIRAKLESPVKEV